MRKKSLTKEQRQIQILQWFSNRVMEDNWKTASLAQIAKGIGISPSSHLRKICETLVESKNLIPVKLKRSGRWEGRGYRPSKHQFKRPERTVVFNFTQNGIRYQMEQLL